MNKCYKVVSTKSGKMQSTISNRYYAAISYKINEVAKPWLGKIFVFKTLRYAKRFKPLDCIILECECGPLEPIIRASAFIHDIVYFWDKNNVFTGTLMRVPHGSQVTEWVKPIKILDR